MNQRSLKQTKDRQLGPEGLNAFAREPEVVKALKALKAFPGGLEGLKAFPREPGLFKEAFPELVLSRELLERYQSLFLNRHRSEGV